jgi:hypothetical protein
MARSGSGTQSQPYIVHNWDELVQSIGEVGAYVEFPLDAVLTTDTTVQRGKLYYKLVSGNYVEVTNPKQSELSTYYENSFEIDLNDEYPEGIPSQGQVGLNVEGYFDGKGGTIRNIYMAAGVNDSSLFLFDKNTSFINTDILNIYFVGRGGNESAVISNRYVGDTANSLMRRCRMSGVIYNSNFYLKNSYKDLKLERCTFAFYGRLGDCGIFSSYGGAYMSAVGFKNCVFDFTCPQMRNFSCYTSSSTNYLYIAASNCLFTGNCTQSSATDIFNRLNSCVFDVVLNGGTVAITYQINNSEVPTVLNISKANLSFLGTTTHIEATQQQIEDASWLLSQGFPVGRLT